MDAQIQKSSEPLIVNRPASVVMKLARMGSFHQSRLSFMRVLLRRLKAENWQFRQAEWQIDEHGVGVATYEAIGPERTYTLVAFAHDLPDEKRSDRVIAEAWDATYTLHDGTISQDDIDPACGECAKARGWSYFRSRTGAITCQSVGAAL